MCYHLNAGLNWIFRDLHPNLGCVTSTSTLSILGHEEVISLDITIFGNDPVILGLPWLSQHNPQVNWSDQSIVFASPYCLAQCLWHSGGSQKFRQSVWLHCLRYTTPQQQQVWACYSPPHSSFPAGHSPANPYNSGPSQEISCERGSFPLRSQDSACLWRHNNSRTQTISPIPILLRMTTTLSRCYVDQQIGPTLSS